MSCVSASRGTRSEMRSKLAIAATGSTAVMARRREPPDALDFFSTPLWATRALFTHVLPTLGVGGIGSVWEPACGEGHMAAVIAEFARQPMIASDVYGYGYGVAPVNSFMMHRSRGRTGSLRTRRSPWPASSPCARLISRPKKSPCWCARNGSKALADMKRCSVIARHRFTRRSLNASRW